MGTFCTTTALDTLMIGVTFDTATTALASKAITWSENQIRKALSKRYAISGDAFQTSTSTPPLLTDICEQLSEGYVYWRNSQGGEESGKRGQLMIKDARLCLESIRDYKADLFDSTGSIIVDISLGSYQVLSTTDGYIETFAEDGQLDWTVDGNKLDDISDDRDSI